MIDELHVFRDDVPIKMGDQRLGLTGGCVEPEAVVVAKEKAVAERLALRARNEGLAPLTGLQRLDVVGTEVVQKSLSVASAQFELDAVAHVEKSHIRHGLRTIFEIVKSTTVVDRNSDDVTAPVESAALIPDG